MEPKDKTKIDKPEWMPKHAVNFCKDVSTLPPGSKWVITLTIRDDTSFYTINAMTPVRH